MHVHVYVVKIDVVKIDVVKIYVVKIDGRTRICMSMYMSNTYAYMHTYVEHIQVYACICSCLITEHIRVCACIC